MILVYLDHPNEGLPWCGNLILSNLTSRETFERSGEYCRFALRKTQSPQLKQFPMISIRTLIKKKFLLITRDFVFVSTDQQMSL